MKTCPIFHKKTEKLISSTGVLISFFSKQALLLSFQIAQQIAANPAIWVVLLAATN
jgi:hypothetical protein